MIVAGADSYTRANAATPGSPEAGSAYSTPTVGGTSGWGIASNQLYATGTTTNSTEFLLQDSGIAPTPSTPWDMTLTLTNVVEIDGYGMGIVFRYQDTNNFYRWLASRPGDGMYYLQKKIAGSWTTMGMVVAVATNGDVMRVIDNGSVILCFRNGVLLYRASSETNFNTMTKAGIIVGRGGGGGNSWRAKNWKWKISQPSDAGGGSSLLRQMLLDSPSHLWPFDDATGATAKDVAAGSTISYGTGITSVPGPTGRLAAFFPGASTQKTVTGYTQTGVTTQTVECWLNIPAGADATILQNRGNGSGTSGRSLSFQVIGGLLYYTLDTDNIVYGRHTAAAVNDGVWHHLVGTVGVTSGSNITPSAVSLYVDGVAVTTGDDTTNFGGSLASPFTGLDAVTIGYGPVQNRVASFAISHLAVYPSVLSATRVKAHYEAGIRAGIVSG